MDSIFRIVVIGLVLAPLAIQAETFNVESVDYRDYKSLFFDPQFIKIQPGDSITFTVTNFDHQPQSVFIPDGAQPWKSETGENITVQFDRAGVYIFDCAYHNVMGMAGVIVVGSSINRQEAGEYYTGYRDETFVMNKDRLDYIWDPENNLLVDKVPAVQDVEDH